MANFGKIYESSWWGEGVCANTIGWGSSYKSIANCSDASFSYAEASYAKNGTDPTPTITGDAGGTFTATPAGLSINSSTGEITLSTSTINSYTVKYTLADGTYADQTLGITAATFTNTYSLAFDGVDDNVIVPYNSSLDVASSSHSLSFWLKTTDGSTQVVMEKGRGGELAVFIISNKIYWGGAWSYYGGTTVVNDGNWHNIIFVADGSSSTIYIDGSSVATKTVALPSTNTDDFVMGTDANGSNAYDGNLDEIAIFNYALTSENVTSIYNSGVPNNLDDLTTPPTLWLRNGDNGTFKSPQWLIPNNSNVSNSRISNYSFSYDGVDDYVDVGNPTELQITGALSISAWVKFTGNTAPIVSKYESGSAARPKSFGLEGDRSGSNHSPKFFIYNSGTIYETPTSVKVVDDGNWHHLLAVFNPSTYLRLYIDGNLEQENTTSIPATIDNDAADFVIGAIKSVGNPVTFFSGNIDEVAVWNSDQSANVASIYNSAVPTTITGSVAHWKMGEEATFSTNWTVPDAVGSNNGTSANMTIEDRTGDAPNSTSNALSYNMTESDRETDVPS